MAETDISVATRLWQKIIGITQDGAFGPATKAATIAWQKKNGLSADGVVGPATWKKAESLGLTGPFAVSELPMLKTISSPSSPKPIKPPQPSLIQPQPKPSNIIPSFKQAGMALYGGLALAVAFIYLALTSKKKPENKYDRQY